MDLGQFEGLLEALMYLSKWEGKKLLTVLGQLEESEYLQSESVLNALRPHQNERCSVTGTHQPCCRLSALVQSAEECIHAVQIPVACGQPLPDRRIAGQQADSAHPVLRLRIY